MIFETRTVAPAAPLIETDVAKEWVRARGFTDDDGLLDRIAATCEGMIEAMTGRALITQTWRLSVAGPDRDGMVELPRVPVASLSEIAYLDRDEVLQTATLSDFALIGGTDRALVRPVDGKVWPSLYARPDALRVTYVAGYGDTAAAVPSGLITAAQLIVGHLYRNPEAVSDKPMQMMPLAVEAMIEPYRTMWVAG